MHGQLLPNEERDIGGIATIARLVADIRQDSPNVLLLDAGDIWQGSARSNENGGDLMIQSMNQIGYDAWVLGNHEFDQGIPNLQQRIASSTMPVLGANVYDSNEHWSAVQDHIVQEINGVRVGIFGLTFPYTPNLYLQSTLGTIQIREPEAIANQQVQSLQDAGVDVIIALSHLGLEQDIHLAQTVAGINIIVGGHSHHLAKDPPQEVNGTILLAAGAFTEYLGHAQVTISPENTVTVNNTLLHVLETGLSPDATIEQLVEERWYAIQEEQEALIGVADAPFTDQAVCNLVADAMRAFREGIDTQPIAVMNRGGVAHTTIPAGDISRYQIESLFPYPNQLTSIRVNGNQLQQLLTLSKGSLCVSGITFTYTEETGATNIMIDGTELDPATSYSLATIDYLAEGGGNWYPVTETIGQQGRADDGTMLSNVLANYISQQSPITPNDEMRILQTNEPVSNLPEPMQTDNLGEPEPRANQPQLPSEPEDITPPVDTALTFTDMGKIVDVSEETEPPANLPHIIKLRPMGLEHSPCDSMYETADSPILYTTKDENEPLFIGETMLICYKNFATGTAIQRVIDPEGNLVSTSEMQTVYNEKYPRADFTMYAALPQDIPGTYTVIAETAEGELTTTFDVSEQIIATSYTSVEWISRDGGGLFSNVTTDNVAYIFLNNFMPNERVDLFLYTSCSEGNAFTGIQVEVQVNEAGRAFLPVPENILATLTQFPSGMLAAIGSRTGPQEVWLLWNESGDTNNIFTAVTSPIRNPTYEREIPACTAVQDIIADPIITGIAPIEEQQPFEYKGISFSYDPSLTDNISVQRVLAQENDPSGFGMIYPSHIRFRFHGYPIESNPPATISVLPIDGYRQISENNARIAEDIDAIDTLLALLAERPDLATTYPDFYPPVYGSQTDPPLLPFYGIRDITAMKLAARMDYLEFTNGSGIRYLTDSSTQPFSIDNRPLYTFQGITDDGKYYVSVKFTVETDLPGTPPEHPQAPEAEDYNAQAFAHLQHAGSDAFTSDLTLLDAMVESIVVNPTAFPFDDELAYIDNNAIWLINIQTKEKQLLTQLDVAETTGLSWSPDGTSLLFTAKPTMEDDTDVYQIDLDDVDAAPIQLTDDPRHEVSPVMASNGTLFFGRFNITENPNSIRHGYNQMIVRKDPDGKETIIAGSETDLSLMRLAPEYLSLSYDEDMLAVSYIEDTMQFDIVDIIDTHTGDIWSLEDYIAIGKEYSLVDWANTQLKLAVFRQSVTGMTAGDSLQVVELGETQTEETLIESVSGVRSIDWSSDDSFIVYETFNDGLWIINSTVSLASYPQQLSDVGRFPTWRPN
jgi:5'-nucleotidase